jgi:ectoine hydroxylase-related dioxygenase (phytanoyl-CoA dioxygenase family)
MDNVLDSQAEMQKPFSKEKTRGMIDQYTRDGYLIIPGIFTPDEAGQMRECIARFFEDDALVESKHRNSELVMTRLFELDPIFVKMLTREPIISLMEEMMGPDCHIIANNAIRNGTGQAIDTFHVDDFLWLPLPEDMPRFDARFQFPNYLANVNHALTDISSDEFGPLQVVPGSHYSGRHPNSPSHPTFEGRGPVSVHVRPGDVYLQHPQVWHRGAPNTSNRTRFICGMGWSRRFVSQRFYPFLNYRVPDHVLKGADERLLRVLGKHAHGAYG